MEEKKSLSFDEFYCEFYIDTLKLNKWILWRILRSERFGRFFPKKDMKEIKTKEELEKKYNSILNKAKKLTINQEIIKKADQLIWTQAN